MSDDEGTGVQPQGEDLTKNPQHREEPALDPWLRFDRNLTFDKDRHEKSALDQPVFDRHKTTDAMRCDE